MRNSQNEGAAENGLLRGGSHTATCASIPAPNR